MWYKILVLFLLQRNGADFSVFINTAQEFDGSDSGARPDEAISWGKIRMDAKPVKVYIGSNRVKFFFGSRTLPLMLSLDFRLWW